MREEKEGYELDERRKAAFLSNDRSRVVISRMREEKAVDELYQRRKAGYEISEGRKTGYWFEERRLRDG
jgi:hypothetical protein